MTDPRLGITLGDAAGVGPEIVAKTLLLHPDLRRRARLVVLGDEGAVRRGCTAAGLNPDSVVVVDRPDDAPEDPKLLPVIQVGSPLGEIAWGELSATAGDGAYRYVVQACDLAKKGQLDGIVTAPLNKAAMHAAGHNFPGHTELLAHEFGVSSFAMVLSAGDLYLFHLTTHVSLRDAIDAVTPTRVDEVFRLAGAVAKASGHPYAPIGLAGLNPHAGENGLFGREEIEILAPAVERARAAGLNAQGPLPADALLPQAMRGKWPFVIACYHDQGHAPFKAVFGNNGVNITVGLPVVRVSVDHGTAFDIAGRGIANEESLVLAVERAAELAPGWGHVWAGPEREDEAER